VRLTWEEVTSMERHVIRHKRECRRLIDEGETDGPKTDAAELPPRDGSLRNDGDGACFSLALSGGGIRAAAFQAGVLWRLAEEGVIQHVEYLAAVSGGGYVAASYLSHLVEEDGVIPPSGPPRRGTNMFYRAAVAKTIVRMQRNAGTFVRGGTLRELLAWPSDGAGRLPRIFDLPILVLVLLVTLAVNPLQFTLLYLVPLSEIVHLFFGAALRTAFCSVDRGLSDLPMVLSTWSPWGKLIQVGHVLLVVNFLLWAANRLPFFQPVPEKEPSSVQYSVQNKRFLAMRASRAFLTRLTFMMAGLALVIYVLPVLEIWAYDVDQPPRTAEQVRYDFCTAYVDDIRLYDRGLGCANFNGDLAWFENPPFSKTLSPEGSVASDSAAPSLERDFIFKEWEWISSLLPLTRTSILGTFIGCLLGVLVLSLPLVPCLPGVFIRLLVLAGPLTVLGIVVAFLQFRIYGPVTGRRLFGMISFDSASWYLMVRLCLWSGFLMVPFYNELQRLLHWYYLRTLQTNYFAGGKDLSFRDFARPFQNGVTPSSLTPTQRRCCYSPFPVFTGTVSDYETLTSDKSVHEIFFSPLHTGSDTIGYAITRHFGTLAKYTALTGAGCLDAVSLTLSQRLRYRFWLEVFNLSWGDYILFDPIENRLIRRMARYARGWCERYVTTRLRRWKNILIWLPFIALLVVSWERALDSGVEDCQDAKSIMIGLVTVGLATFMASFFAFHPWAESLMYSPLLRQLHMGTKYHFKGRHPPGMLYVTDGGAQDCTCIIQLIRRKRARILLVLAAADPDDELRVLRTTMHSAVEEKLCSFFDPAEPLRNITFTLEEWANDKSRCYFELGICYGSRGQLDGSTQELGRLVVVKNRLPDDLRDMPARPHITESEVLGQEDVLQASAGEKTRKSAELGAACCCDCIHGRGLNCGRKFPHLTAANYMWLTPLTFSSLCRLGYLMSKDAVQVISKEGSWSSSHSRVTGL
jgi:hypothetical protein